MDLIPILIESTELPKIDKFHKRRKIGLTHSLLYLPRYEVKKAMVRRVT